MYGPPLAGTSTQATLLGSRYGLPVVCVDGLLQAAYSLEKAEAATAAAAAAPATPAGTSGSPGRTPKRQLLELLTKMLFFSAPLGPTDFGSPPPARGQSAASGHAAGHSPGHAAASTAADTQHQLQRVPDVLTAALQLALQQEQYSKGFIIDGLCSKHMPNGGVVARCLLQAVGLVCKSLHPPEPSPPPASAGAAKGTKAPSRPPSSRPGVKAAPVPEVVLPIMTFSSPDVWEGSQQVGAEREHAACFHASDIKCSSIACATAWLRIEAAGCCQHCRSPYKFAVKHFRLKRPALQTEQHSSHACVCAAAGACGGAPAQQGGSTEAAPGCCSSRGSWVGGGRPGGRSLTEPAGRGKLHAAATTAVTTARGSGRACLYNQARANCTHMRLNCSLHMNTTYPSQECATGCVQ